MVLTISEIVEIAKQIVAEEFGEWPEDEWFSLGDSLDCNAYVQDDKMLLAIYPTDGVNTLTQVGIVIEL